MNRQKPSIKDLRTTYTEERAFNDRMSGPAVYYIMRPLSYYPTWLAIRLGISANQVSVISLIFMVAGCVLLALGSHPTIIIGAVLLNIYHLLDSADGNVARYTGQAGSRFGKFIEPFGGILDGALIFPCVGIGAFNNPGFFPIEMAGWIFIVLGVSTSAINFTTPWITARLQRQPVSRGLHDYQRLSDFRLYRGALQTIGGNYLLLLLLLSILNALGIYILIQLLFATGNLLLRNIRF